MAPDVIESGHRGVASGRSRRSRAVAPAALAALLLVAATLPVPAAQLVVVDVRPLADAYRASQIIGASVVNDTNETIGKVDDLIVARADKVLFSVVSVGGFLGIGQKLVAVPYASLVISDADNKMKIQLPGATKAALKALPEFRFSR